VVNTCEDFSPETALFIANKWENIPDGDKDDVQQDILAKLSEVYPGVNEKQIHFMSVSMVSEHLLEESCRPTNCKHITPTSWRIYICMI